MEVALGDGAKISNGHGYWDETAHYRSFSPELLPLAFC